MVNKGKKRDTTHQRLICKRESDEYKNVRTLLSMPDPIIPRMHDIDDEIPLCSLYPSLPGANRDDIA